MLACDVDAGSGAPTATGLLRPAAVAVGSDGAVWVAENESIPGIAHVRALGTGPGG